MISYLKPMNLVSTVSSYYRIGNCSRSFSRLNNNSSNSTQKEWSLKISQFDELQRNLRKYGASIPEAEIKKLPRSVWTRKSDFSIVYSCTIHKKVAETIAERVLKAVQTKNQEVAVIELNPGFGLITEKLLQGGLEELIVYNPVSFESFERILEKYRTRLTLHVENAFATVLHPKMYAYLRVFRDISNMKDKRIIIVGVSPNRLFYRRVIYYIANLSPSFGQNAEFYLTMPDVVFNCLVTNSDKNSRTFDYACFNALFSVNILEEYPRDCFIPLSMFPNQHVHLVRIALKDHMFSQDDLQLYMNFLRVLCKQKKNSVIAELEKWFPGSGPYFISKGVSVTNKISEFSSDDFLILFNILKQMEGHEQSFFVLQKFEALDELEDTDQ